MGIKLNGTADTLQAKLASAVTTTQPDFFVSYVNINSTALVGADNTDGTLNDTTAVNLLAGVASRQLTVNTIDIFNRDTQPVVLTIQMDVSGTPRTLYKATLGVDESLHYNDGAWSISNSAGVPAWMCRCSLHRA
jgi:hypothetical protein